MRVEVLVKSCVVLLLVKCCRMQVTNNSTQIEEDGNQDINLQRINPYATPEIEDSESFLNTSVPQVEQVEEDYYFIPSLDDLQIPQDMFRAGGDPVPSETFDDQLVLDDKKYPPLFSRFVRDDGGREIIPRGNRAFDDRTLVKNSNQMPFRSIGKVGTHCTGTVIGRRHVITSAHCVYVYKSDRYAENIKFQPALNVGFEPYPEYDWLYAFVPEEWKDGDINFDYAIIILKEQLPTEIEPISFGNNCQKTKTHNLNIAGYPIDKNPKNGMWTTACLDIQIDCFIYSYLHKCDATKGMSGSSMISYIKDFNGNPQFTILGIHQGYKTKKDLNIAIHINQQIENKINEYLRAFP